MTDNVSSRTRIAILGGGAGAISAAFWLSAPGMRDRYQVTVYTQGWRLGGKCATGRNTDHHDRIEEHGLHILMGCYENAFRTLRACYGEWRPDPECPFQDWQQAFLPQRDMVLMERDGPGDPPAWVPWSFTFPGNPLTPGDGKALWPELLGTLLDPSRDIMMIQELGRRLHQEFLVSLPADVLAGFGDAVHALLHALSLAPHGQAKEVGEHLQRVGHAAIQQHDAGAPGGAWHRWRNMANLGLAMLKGLVADWGHYGEHAYDERNKQDLRAWLRSHGASEEALAFAPVRALYELTFAFRGGDTSSIDNGQIAAGAAVRFMLEAVLGYKGAPLWEMQAGMGETVFTPFYQVLAGRRVQIEFFHRVKDLRLNEDGYVGSVRLWRQANLRDGAYKPFVRVKGLDCWPSQPLWAQLENGEHLRDAGVNFESIDDETHSAERLLELGADFDCVVLAMPPEAIKRAAPSLAGRLSRWDDMLASSASVATQALQVWANPGYEQLGWTLGHTVLGAYSEAYDSTADMTHLLARESWPAGGAQTLWYFCGCLRTVPAPPPDPDQAARQQAEAWLRQSIGVLWPEAVQPDESLRPGVRAEDYSRANVDPTELYVQTPPGSVQYRLSSGDAIFNNLYVAGDWTLTRFSGGCFESAIESGMRAAAAICGEPKHIVGE